MPPLKIVGRKAASAPPRAGNAGVEASGEGPAQRAERLFGGPAHLVLVSDDGPAMSFLGWTLGTARAECIEHVTAPSRAAVVDILFSVSGRYVVSERVETRLSDGALRLSAKVSKFRLARDIRRYCEAPTLDAQADVARGAAFDHAFQVWPWLKRPARTVTNAAAATSSMRP
jgi:hypothetical protein